MVNAPNAAKKYPLCRKKLWLNLPTKQVEDTDSFSPEAFLPQNSIVMEKIKCSNVDTEI
jgi:hypothetical protein